jgi:hypothetical protein
MPHPERILRLECTWKPKLKGSSENIFVLPEQAKKLKKQKKN